jgi:hypothetical protein
MKKLIAGLLLALACVLNGSPQELLNFVPPDPHHSNSFSQSNPDYRTRAGGFYEETYIDEAASALCAESGIDDSQEDLVRALLRGYVYRWLDAYVEGSGRRSELTDQEERWLDEQIPVVLGESAEVGYLRWKRSPENSLGFLF